MSSSVNRRIFRSPEAEEDVVVVGESVRRRLASDDPIATVTTLLAGANQRVEAIVAEARARAEAIVAEAGAEVGIQGAAIATAAMKEAAKAALSGDKTSIEERMKAQTDAIKVSAQALCDRLPALLDAQRAAAELVPEFKPYANMDEKDIMECSADLEGAAP